MDRTRLVERTRDFLAALARLEDACARPKDEYVRDSVIQRFEFTYELAWKMMKLWLEGKDIDVRNAKDTLQEALVQGLIEDGNRWTELHRYRNLTSHTYNLPLADEVYDFVRRDGVQLFGALAEKTHGWNA